MSVYQAISYASTIVGVRVMAEVTYVTDLDLKKPKQIPVSAKAENRILSVTKNPDFGLRGRRLESMLKRLLGQRF
jgi:hypothetical protein